MAINLRTKIGKTAEEQFWRRCDAIGHALVEKLSSESQCESYIREAERIAESVYVQLCPATGSRRIMAHCANYPHFYKSYHLEQ